MRIGFCDGVGYNRTSLPNSLGMTSQTDISMELSMYHPLVKIECSNATQFFLCSVYAPKCDGVTPVLPPCRSVCSETKDGCGPLMARFGFPWPGNLNCEQFPETGQCVMP